MPTELFSLPSPPVARRVADPSPSMGGGDAIAVPALTDAESAALDDAAELARYTDWDTGADGRRLGRSRLLLEGMHCAACAGLIEAAAARVPGVVAVDVNGATHRGELRWDPERTRPSDWMAAIRRAGYRAYPDTGATAVEMHRGEARKAMWRLFVAGFCMMQVMMYATPAYVAAPGDMSPDLDQLLRWASWVLSIPVLVFSAGPFFSGAWKALRQKRIGMDVPVALGIAVTFIASTGATFDRGGVFGSEVYFDSLTMFVSFLLAGRYLELWARSRTAQSLDAVLRRLPDSVERLREGVEPERVSLSRLVVGDRVRIAAGQAFAADGVITEGRTEVDEALLTGESRPVPRGQGEAVVAGSINLSAPVVMRVERLGGDTHYQRIVELMQRAVMDKPSLVRSADRIAGPFLWGVLALALGAALAWHWIDPARSIWVAVSVLIVTCPCALSLAAPSAMLTAAGVLARKGILVQRLDALEALAETDTVIFDKTGTVSDERLGVARIAETGPASERALCRGVALALASRSTHPVSQAVTLACREAGADAGVALLRDVVEHPGLGMEARDSQGRRWRLGSQAWVGAGRAADGHGPAADEARAAVWLGNEDGPQLVFEIDECVRPDAAAAIQSLQAQGLRVELLSGDRQARVTAMARSLGVDAARAQAAPEDKLDAVTSAQAQGRHVIGVGDGLNDAPWLGRADVSMVLGHGAALAQSRADFVLVGGQLAGVAQARLLARQAMQVVKQNMRWAVIYNLVCVPLAVVGWLPPWLAGLGMASSSLVVVLNALRLSRTPLDLPLQAPRSIPAALPSLA